MADVPLLRRFKCVTLVAATAFMASVGLILGIRYLIFMAGLLALLPVVSVLLSVLSLYGLSSRRFLPAEAEEGEEVPVVLTVSNASRLPRFLLQICDRTPEGSEADGDREVSVSGLWPGEEVEVRYKVRLLGRGWISYPDPVIKAFDLLGFSTRSRRLPTPSGLTLLPRPAPVPQWLPLGVGPFQGAVAVKGTGPDFHGVREYQPGDDLRRIHWKLTARKGELVVREVEEEHGGDVALSLLLPPEASEDLRERAVRVAVGVARAVAERGANLILIRPRAKVRKFPPTEWGALRRLLAELEPEPPDIDGILGTASVHLGGGPILVVAPLPCSSASRLPPGRAVLIGVAGGPLPERPPALRALAVPAGPEPFAVAWE